jgi:hypothetical protein
LTAACSPAIAAIRFSNGVIQGRSGPALLGEQVSPIFLGLSGPLATRWSLRQHTPMPEFFVMSRIAIAVLLFTVFAAAAASSDLAVAVAGMLAAEQQCSGIMLNHALIDRIVAGETTKDRSFEYCVRDGCLRGATALLRAMPADEKASACASWKKTIGDAGFMLRH